MTTKISRQLTISSWNVNGLFKRIDGQRFCKLDDIDFQRKLTSDIIFLCETHAQLNEALSLEGYRYIANCRTEDNRRSSKRGLGIFIKHSIVKGIKIVDKSCSEYLWLRLDQQFFGLKRNLFLCCAYIPPANSTFTLRTGIDKEIFDKIEDSIANWSNQGDIMIMGDLNAHINKNNHDYIPADANDPLDDILPNTYIADNTPPRRNTLTEQVTNTYGRQLLDLCVSVQL